MKDEDRDAWAESRRAEYDAKVALAEEVQQLDSLYALGVLNAEEFEQAKRRLIEMSARYPLTASTNRKNRVSAG